jgi:hypothetical protein
MGLLRIVIGVPVKVALLWFLMPHEPSLLLEPPVAIPQFQQLDLLHATIVTGLNRVGRDIRLHGDRSKGGNGQLFPGTRNDAKSF